MEVVMQGFWTRNACVASVALLVIGGMAQADTLYSNGFETNTTDWSAGVTRVASGTGGVTSASGAFHGQAVAGSFTRWGGYNYGAGSVPTSFIEYSTSLSIYLDMDTSAANDTRFDYTSAISNSAGNHLRDFAFAGGFYNDGGNDRFVFSASNNTPGWPGNPDRDPVTISTTGWYQFQHHFYDNAGVLAVDMNILDSMNNIVGSWTLSNPADLIAGVGGNRYGWLPNIGAGFGNLAIDNAMLSVVPLPPAAWAGLTVLGGIGAAHLVRRRRHLS
jgi:hypothetical protein